MSTSSGVRYSLNVVNHSANTSTVCLYQNDPDGLPNVQSLAWFVQEVPPSTNVTFNWTINYGFTWSQTAPLTPGVVHNPSQMWPADLETTNAVTLTRRRPYTFTDQKKGDRSGSLFITLDETIRPREVAVGISMSDAGVFAVDATPSTTLVFAPHPAYWIAAGQVQQGQVLDPDGMTNAVSVEFPPNVFAMTATLNADNTWTISAG